MSSVVEVYNLAATRMGSVTRISSPDDDRHVARTIRAVFDLQRRAAIRDGAWNFATRRAELPAEYNPDRVIYPWAYAFPMPAEDVRLLEVLGCSRDQYEYLDNVICANVAGPLYVRHLVDVPEPADWDEGFAHSFGLRLAYVCGRMVAGSAFDAGLCWDEYRASLAAAKRVDARENPGPGQDESDWVLARFRGGGVSRSTNGW
jgi:hypothetical protein